MPGRLGGEAMTFKNIWLYKVRWFVGWLVVVLQLRAGASVCGVFRWWGSYLMRSSLNHRILIHCLFPIQHLDTPPCGIGNPLLTLFPTQQVDPQRNLLYVRGQVPGPAGSFVLVRDAFRWRWTERQAVGLPFPTHIPTGQEEELSAVEVAKRDKSDPYRVS